MARHFFISGKNIQGKIASLDFAESHHLTGVLRKKKGDSLCLLTGQGKLYEGKILSTSPTVKVEILSSRVLEEASSPLLVLCPALLKNNKMDWLIEKATELGVHAILPFEAEHGVVQIEKGGAAKIVRWERIAQASLKQSGRGLVPQIGPVLSFEELLARYQNKEALKLIFSLENIHSIPLKNFHAFLRQSHQEALWVFLIGPEGGFSPQEEKKAQEAGFQLCSLGLNTLRAETAGIAALSILKFLREGL